MPSPLQSRSAIPGGSTHVSTKRSLFASRLESGQSPPQWFTDLFKGFEARLENYIETIALARFNELSSTLDKEDEKLSHALCRLYADDENQVKKLKLEKLTS